MADFQIAELNIITGGLENEYFNNRMKDYFSHNSELPVHLNVDYRFNPDIQIPQGTFVAKTSLRTYLKQNSDYVYYDYLFRSETYVASVKANSDWSKVQYEMSDVEHLGGTSTNIRSFNCLGEIFKHSILFHKGFVLHASALSYMENGILFSAPSGTGKSTHTGLWQEFYPKDSFVFNDDSPAIRFIDDIPYAYGTPWSGKTEINKNLKVPLKGIVFLEQAPENSIKRLSAPEAIFRIFSQIIKPVYSELSPLIADNVSKIIETVPIYLLKCRIDKEAVDLVKEAVIG